MTGIIRYDEEGLPICEICGGSFDRLLTHVRQKHFMSARDYKIQNGLDLNKGICSKRSALKSKLKVQENFDVVVAKNLLSKGLDTRFKLNAPGRTKDKVSAQTKIRLKENLKKPNVVAAMQESGRIVGKSGLGNKKRWGK